VSVIPLIGLETRLWFPPAIKLTNYDISEILLKLVLITVHKPKSYGERAKTGWLVIRVGRHIYP
jgi:hypothetical protein